MVGLRWLLPAGAHWNIWSQWLSSGLRDVPSVQTRECLRWSLQEQVSDLRSSQYCWHDLFSQKCPQQF